jgi:hypothetical protein
MSLPRRDFLLQFGIVSTAAMLAPARALGVSPIPHFKGIVVDTPMAGEDLFAYIHRKSGGVDLSPLVEFRQNALKNGCAEFCG